VTHISEEEHSERLRAFREAIASLWISGLDLDDEAKRILERHVDTLGVGALIAFEQIDEALYWHHLGQRKQGRLGTPSGQK
jgi:hypothetical protein